MERPRRLTSAVSLRFHRALLVLAVVGWSGVTVRHVLPTHATDEAFDFEPGAVEVLFDAQPEWEGKLLQALLIDPTVASYNGAVALIDEMCKVQEGILPAMAW